MYSLYTLFTPILPERIRLVYKIFAPASALFFIAGAVFAYYVVMPRMLTFLLGFSEGIAIPFIEIDAYLDLLFNMAFWFGVIFQVPLAMFLLAKLDIVGYRRMRRIRRGFAIFAIIASIIITPTFDGISMAMMAVPMYVVYELGLFLAWMARPEEGNYLFIKSVYYGVRWTLRRPIVTYRWMIGLPARLWRKIFR